MESALTLYDRSLDLAESPLVLFNLAQAYGRAFQVDNLARTLERAQSLDGVAVAELTQLQGATPEGFVVDLPIPDTLVWQRVMASDAGETIAAELRRPLAPGQLGRDATGAAHRVRRRDRGGVGVRRAPLAVALVRALQRSPVPALPPGIAGQRRVRDLHAALLPARDHRPRAAARADHGAARARAAARARRDDRVDRAAGGRRRCWRGVRCSRCSAPCSSRSRPARWSGATGVVPDPLVAGAAAPFAFLGAAVLAALGYAVVVGAALAARRRL